MDFGSWSPSHTILALFIVVGFISQIGALFYRVGQTEKRLTRSEERAEKRDAALLAMIDKRMGEVNLRIDGLRAEMKQQIGEVNLRVDGLRTEMNHQGESLRSEMQQQIGEVNLRIDGLRAEMNQQEESLRSAINHQGESLRSEMKQQGESLRSEMNQRLSDMDASIRQLNQNHIEHLTYHQHTESAAQ